MTQEKKSTQAKKVTTAKKEKFLKVPYAQQVSGKEEVRAVVKALEATTQMGVYVRDLQTRVAKLFDKKYGVGVNSGSSALLLAMESFEFPKGSEVITPALTFSTTVSSILKAGLIPSFVDVEPATFCVDPEKIKEMITPKTKAILAPNLIGNICNWPAITLIAKRHGLKIIEDSADTLGATLGGKSSGHFADVSTTSFYGSHIVSAAGNGGMICLNDKEQLRRILLLRSWGRSSSLFVDSEAIENRFSVKVDGIPYDAKFVFEAIGYNLEPSEIGAAFGLVQLKKLGSNLRTRQKNFKKQYAFFKQYERWFILPVQTPDTSTGWLAFPVIVRPEAPFKRTALQIFLEKRGIQTRVLFTGNILRQPGFKNIECKVTREGYPNADRVMRGGMLIACHHGLSKEMLAHVHEALTEFLGQY